MFPTQYIDGLVQDCSSPSAMEIMQSCTKQSTWESFDMRDVTMQCLSRFITLDTSVCLDYWYESEYDDTCISNYEHNVLGTEGYEQDSKYLMYESKGTSTWTLTYSPHYCPLWPTDHKWITLKKGQ